MNPITHHRSRSLVLPFLLATIACLTFASSRPAHAQVPDLVGLVLNLSRQLSVGGSPQKGAFFSVYEQLTTFSTIQFKGYIWEPNIGLTPMQGVIPIGEFLYDPTSAPGLIKFTETYIQPVTKATVTKEYTGSYVNNVGGPQIQGWYTINTVYPAAGLFTLAPTTSTYLYFSTRFINF